MTNELSKEVPSSAHNRPARLVFIVFSIFGILAVSYLVSSFPYNVRPIGDAEDTWIHSTIKTQCLDLKRTIVSAISPALAKTESISESPEVKNALSLGVSSNLQSLANEIIRESTEVDVIAFFNSEGSIVACNSVDFSGKEYDEDRIRQVMTADFSKTEVVTSCLFNETKSKQLEFQLSCDFSPVYFLSSGLAVAYSVPIFDQENNNLIGAVSTRLNFSRLTNLIPMNPLRDGDTSTYFVADNGQFFDEEINAGNIEAPIRKAEIANILSNMNRANLDIFEAEADGYYLLAASVPNFKTMEGGGINIVSITPSSWVFEHVRDLALQSWYLETLHLTSIALLLILILFIMKFLLKPKPEKIGASNTLSHDRSRDIKQVAILSFGWLIVMAVALTLLWHQSKEMNEATALRDAQHVSSTLNSLRQIYTADVVTKARNNGMRISHLHENDSKAIPLPATLSMRVGSALSRSKEGISTSLYSPFPFKNSIRKDSQFDEFQRKAWDKFTTTSEYNYFEITEYQENPYLLEYLDLIGEILELRGSDFWMHILALKRFHPDRHTIEFGIRELKLHQFQHDQICWRR